MTSTPQRMHSITTAIAIAAAFAAAAAFGSPATEAGAAFFGRSASFAPTPHAPTAPVSMPPARDCAGFFCGPVRPIVPVPNPWVSRPLMVTSPNGGERWAAGSVHSVTWTAPSTTQAVDIYLQPACPPALRSCYTIQAIIPVASGVPNTGAYSWTVSAGALGTQAYQAADSWYVVTVVDSRAPGLSDSSDSSFAITSAAGQNPQGPRVTSPAAGENWPTGSVQGITWAGFTGPVDIYLQPWAACLDSNPRCALAVAEPSLIVSGVTGGFYGWTVRGMGAIQPQLFSAGNGLFARPSFYRPNTGFYRIIVRNSTQSATGGTFMISYESLVPRCLATPGCPQPAEGGANANALCRCGIVNPPPAAQPQPSPFPALPYVRRSFF